MKLLCSFVFLILTLSQKAAPNAEITNVNQLPVVTKEFLSLDGICKSSSWGVIQKAHQEQDCTETCQKCNGFNSCDTPFSDFENHGFLITYIKNGETLKEGKDILLSGAPLLFEETKNFCFCQTDTVLNYIDAKSTVLTEISKFKDRLNAIRSHVSASKEILTKASQKKARDRLLADLSQFSVKVVEPLFLWFNEQTSNENDMSFLKELLEKIMILSDVKITKAHKVYPDQVVKKHVEDMEKLINVNDVLITLDVVTMVIQTKKQDVRVHRCKAETPVQTNVQQLETAPPSQVDTSQDNNCPSFYHPPSTNLQHPCVQILCPYSFW